MKERRQARMRTIAEVVGEYSFCVGLAAWAGPMGAWTLIMSPPSLSLDLLPRGLQIGWGIAMVVASAATFLGLVVRRHSLLIVRALILFAFTFSIYAVAVLAQTDGWSRGGGIATLMFVYAVVCVFRSRYLLRSFTLHYQEIEDEGGEKRELGQA